MAFSIPGSFDSIDNDPRIHTTEKLTFMLRQKRGKLLLDFPDAGETQPWPPHWKLSSSLPPSVKDNPILTRDYDATPGSFSDDVFCVVFVMDAARDKFLEMKLDDIEKLSSDQVDDLEFFGRISPALMHPSIIYPLLSDRRRQQTLPGIMEVQLWPRVSIIHSTKCNNVGSHCSYGRLYRPPRVIRFHSSKSLDAFQSVPRAGVFRRSCLCCVSTAYRPFA